MDRSGTPDGPDDAPPAGGHRRAWRLILVATLVSALGSGLTLPYLIVYLHDIRHVGLPVAGLVVAGGAVSGLVVGTLSGSVGDRLGVGRVLGTGVILSSVGTAALAGVHSAPEAALAVAVTGCGDAVLWPALNALVATLVPAAGRARAYGLRFGVLNAGLGAGALIGGFAVSLRRPGSFEAVYLLDALSTLVAGLVVVAGLWRSGGLPRPAAPAPGDTPAAGGYRAVLADRRFVAWLACSVLFILFGYSQLDGAWAAFATGVVHPPPRVVGIGFGVNTSVIVCSQLGVTRLTRRWRRSRLLAAVGGCWCLAWAVTGLASWSALAGAPADVALGAALGVFALGETFLSPVAGALPNDLAPEHLRVRYNALASTVWSVGGLVGPPLAGVLLGSGAPLSWDVVVAAGAALAAVGGWRLGRHLPPEIDRPPLARALVAPAR